jgi:multidrug resistance efflux pump
MTSRGLLPAAASILLWVCSCARPGPPGVEVAVAHLPDSGSRARREVRIAGLVQAVHSVKVLVPQIQGQFSQMTLTQLVPNGSRVKEGSLVAVFDATQQADAAREAQAKFEDLSHQVDQKLAENRANAENRASDLRQAEGDLAKAQLEMKKGAILSEIERLQNEARAAGAHVHVESLGRSTAFRDKADQAALRILELQRDRQNIAMQRAQGNIQKLEIQAPLTGMVVHELTYRAGSYGHAQEGDQMYRGYPLVSIFDPSEMQVRCPVNESDVLALRPGGAATVYLDAYPELALPAHFLSVNPVAYSPLGTPIKSFSAVFRIDRPSSHLLPDLSAAVVLAGPAGAAGGAP